LPTWTKGWCSTLRRSFYTAQRADDGYCIKASAEAHFGMISPRRLSRSTGFPRRGRRSAPEQVVLRDGFAEC
jgi:hypothetical protein